MGVLHPVLLRSVGVDRVRRGRGEPGCVGLGPRVQGYTGGRSDRVEW